MAFYSLPIERYKVDVPKEFCYLVIAKYPENYYKNQLEKKLSKQELKNRKNDLIKQQTTIKVLDSGYCNLYNNEIELDTIFDSFFTSYLENKDAIIYRIDPLSSHEDRHSYGYSRPIYKISEFNVIKKLTNKNEVIDQIYNDGLLKEFSATFFDNYSYANEGYNLKIYEYFRYIKDTYPEFEISLSDIMLTSDYEHRVRSKFVKNDTYEITRNNIRYLLNNDLIKYVQKYDYTVKLITGLIECGLFDIALQCIKLFDDTDKKYLKDSKDFNLTLRKWTTNKDVKEIINLLEITIDGVILTIKADQGYGNYIKETKSFDNIGEAKTYIIKNYDVSFDKIINKDITDIKAYSEGSDIEYSFEVS